MVKVPYPPALFAGELTSAKVLAGLSTSVSVSVPVAVSVPDFALATPPA